MLTTKCVEIWSTPLTTAPRRSSMYDFHRSERGGGESFIMINKTISCGTIGKCLKTICHAFTQAMRGKLGWWELFGSLTVANRMCVCVCVKLWWLFLYNSSNYTEWNRSCSRYLVLFYIMVYQIIANLSILIMYVCMYVCMYVGMYVCMWVWDCVVVVSMFFFIYAFLSKDDDNPPRVN